jgi:hypothetical protein
MLSAVSAWIIFASPPKALISSAMPRFLKIPVSTPMSAGECRDSEGAGHPHRRSLREH